jgi:hypothetical protein
MCVGLIIISADSLMEFLKMLSSQECLCPSLLTYKAKTGISQRKVLQKASGDVT